MSLNDFLAQLPDGINEIIARVALVIVALLVIIFMRRLLTWLILRPLRRLVKRGGYDDDKNVVDVIASPMRFFIIAIGLAVSVQVIPTNPEIVRIVYGISRSFIIISVLFFIYNLVDLLAPSSLRIANLTGLAIEDRLLPFMRVAIKTFILAVSVVILLQEWGYDVSGLIAGIGIGGLALSLAAQDTLANLFGFVAIVSDRPFDVGETIRTSDVEGVVEHVGLRSTRIRQPNQAVVYMPNNVVANSAILNWSRLKKRQMDLRIKVSYSTTNDQLRMMMQRTRAMLTGQNTVEGASVVVNILDFNTQTVEILVRAYIFLADWKLFTAEKERLTLELITIMKSLDIELSGAITDVRITQAPSEEITNG
ncbi:MAG TPA: mechanosensitive ion channel [Aggregatilineales bacterium]|nr:mechanosensitive ion channel [Aggregatilineales bacterium]